MRGLCLNWKVVAGLAVVGLGIWALAPGVWTAAAPLLIAAACPLSMVIMGLAMRGGQQNAEGGVACAMPQRTPREDSAHVPVAIATSREAQIAELRAELAHTRERQEAITRQIGALKAADVPAVRQAEAVAESAARRAAHTEGAPLRN